jgi:hypothetical protein
LEEQWSRSGQRLSASRRGIQGCGNQRNETGREELATVHVGVSQVDTDDLSNLNLPQNSK